MTSHSLKALFFDQDGVIADTERDGHRVAFNRAFADLDLGFQWSVEEYGELLKIGGGRERFLHYLTENRIGDEGSRQEFAKKVHKLKTELFIDLIEKGEIPARPGVRRIMSEALGHGLVVGICTTSQERAARAISGTLLDGIDLNFILAGDIVANKKPDPEIYRMALEKTGLKPEECLVIEDSRNGMLAAVGAGIPVVATVNGYTRDEDLSAAEIILSSLGDSDDPAEIIGSKHVPDVKSSVVTLEDLILIHEKSVCTIT